MAVSIVILAGGKGERFWPRSREAMPKQFIQLTDQGTMLQLTFNRARRIVPCDNIYVVTGTKYSGLVSQQLPEIPVENIIIEPEGRNTAPCIGLAAIILEQSDPESIMVVLPADHYIVNEEKFIFTLKVAAELAAVEDSFITLGIIPTRPETGYGYIEMGSQGDFAGISFYRVASFKEKPNYDTAQKYLSSGKFLWNSGMFVWPVRLLMQEIQNHQPHLYEGLQKIRAGIDSEDYKESLLKVYGTLHKESIDYALLEKVDKILVIPSEFGWDDVGSWAALPRVFNVDAEGNFLQGSVVALGAHNCIIDGKTKLIAAVGVEDLVVIDTEDAILICPKDRAQDIKLILEQLRDKKMENYL